MHNHNDETPPTGRYATDEPTYSLLGKAGISFIAFVAFCATFAVVTYFVFVNFDKPEVKHVFDSAPKSMDANVPILQKDPVKDIHKFREEEWNNEHTYAHWQDGDGKASLRIPVDRAMEIVKQKGLPTSPPAQAATSPARPTAATGVANGTPNP